MDKNHRDCFLIEGREYYRNLFYHLLGDALYYILYLAFRNMKVLLNVRLLHLVTVCEVIG